MEYLSILNNSSGPVFDDFKTQVESLGSGIKAHERPNNHWQIKVGKATINYYPKSQNRTVYVNSVPGLLLSQTLYSVDYDKCLKLVQDIYKKINS